MADQYSAKKPNINLCLNSFNTSNRNQKRVVYFYIANTTSKAAQTSGLFFGLNIMLRRFTLDDIPQLLTLCEALYLENKNFKIGFDFKVVINTLTGILASDDACGFVYEVDDSIVGMALGVLGDTAFSSQKVARDLGIYVAPSFRGSRAGYELIKSFTEWAKQNAAMTLVSFNSGIETESTLKILEKCGYESIGTTLALRT